MIPLSPATLDSMAPPPAAAFQPRLISIWEITSWILPMAPEHFRRVLAATPSLPQGTAGAEGGTRWFTPADLVPLRAHFAAGPRKARYQPARPARAPLVALTGPLGGMGRTTCLLHLAVAGALSGYRILVIDGDAGGALSRALPAAQRGLTGQGVLSLMARSAALHLRALNEARLDRGDAPQPMDDRLTAALTLSAPDLILPTIWPGLDLMPLSGPALAGDALIAGWRQALRGWQPGPGLVAGLEGLRQAYDLILCDMSRGLGPLTMALLAAADILLAPLPLQDPAEGAPARLATGLQALAEVRALGEAEARTLAQALGQILPPPAPLQLLVLPSRAGPDAARQMAGFAAKLGNALLPNPVPEIEAVSSGKVAHLYDLEYRSIGRLAYGGLREACDAASLAAIRALAGFAPSP